MTRAAPTLCAVAVIAAAAALPRTAEAQRSTGRLSVDLTFGANGLTDDDYVERRSSVDIDALVGLSVAGMHRIIPYVSAGLVFYYGFLYAHGDNLEGEYADFLSILPEVRGHYAIGRFEPWVGFGLGYAMTHGQASGEWGFGPWSGETKGLIMLHGVGISISTGLQIGITDSLSLGPYFRMVFGVWPTACYRYETETATRTVTEDDCDELDEVYGDEPDLPHLWSVGINLTNTF